ncbi:MAG: TrbI/VirB10 family protein, partial [Prosthecobacter sp.]
QPGKGANTAATEPPPAASTDAATKTGKEKNVERGKVAQAAPIERMVLPPPKAPPPSVVQISGGQKKDAPPPPLPTLVHVKNPAPLPEYKPQTPTVFAPRGLLVKAALVITVDSSSLETPLLALVTEDVFWNNKLIVPAGTQVSGKASQGRTRDRIEVKGTFAFTWADGREYSINGVALDHERLPDGSYGLTDGSAGIRGQIIKNDQYGELKIMVAEALSGIMNNQQSQFQTIGGLVPDNTNRNSALGGGSSAASAYSQLLTKKLDQDLDFVRVAAGTQFYIYTMDVFEPNLASIAGITQGGKPTSSWQIAEESYARAQKENSAALGAAAEAETKSRDAEAQAIQNGNVDRVRDLVSNTATPTRTTAPATPMKTVSPNP